MARGLKAREEYLLNWNSIVRTVASFTVYLALVSAYFAGFSPLAFALFSALVLSIGLCVHSIDLSLFSNKLAKRFNASNSTTTVVPPLSVSMAQLHALQTDINVLQSQFSNEVALRSNPVNPDGFAN